jgi:hypothetical protein
MQAWSRNTVTGPALSLWLESNTDRLLYSLVWIMYSCMSFPCMVFRVCFYRPCFYLKGKLCVSKLWWILKLCVWSKSRLCYCNFRLRECALCSEFPVFCRQWAEYLRRLHHHGLQATGPHWRPDHGPPTGREWVMLSRIMTPVIMRYRKREWCCLEYCVTKV